MKNGTRRKLVLLQSFPLTVRPARVSSRPIFTTSMDELLHLLRQNARTSNENLARELNSTPTAVAEKIARLEEEGVILGYQAVIDVQQRAADVVTAVVEVKITPERGGGFDRLANRISSFGAG